MEATGGYENVFKNNAGRERKRMRERQKLNPEKCQPANSRGINAKGRWRTRITETKREKV